MTLALVALGLLLALPHDAAACASCIASPYGDRTYNVAYIGLILTPFAVMVTIGAVITRSWWTRRHDTDDPIDPQLNQPCEAAPVGCEAAPVEKT